MQQRERSRHEVVCLIIVLARILHLELELSEKFFVLVLVDVGTPGIRQLKQPIKQLLFVQVVLQLRWLLLALLVLAVILVLRIVVEVLLDELGQLIRVNCRPQQHAHLHEDAEVLFFGDDAVRVGTGPLELF